VTIILREAAQSPGERAFRASMERAWAELDRLDADALRRVRDRIAEFRADILDRLADLPTATIDDVETFQATSLRAFAAELEDAGARYAQRASLELGHDLRAAGAMSDAAHRAALAALARANDVPPSLIVLSPLGIADEQIEAAVLFSNSAITNVSQAVIQTVNAELQRVVFGGGSRWDAIKNIRAALATTGQNPGALTSRAEMIARTGLIATFNIAAEHAYRQATDELPDLQVEWMATPGARTCPTCSALNGKRKAPGGTFPGGVVAPPRHPRCRCRVVAYLPAWGEQ
jgi:SPP1 gp7 family putative phage head morphogenesis protein